MAKRKKDKRTNNDPQKTHSKPKIEQHDPHQKPGANPGAPERQAAPTPPAASVKSIHQQIWG